MFNPPPHDRPPEESALIGLISDSHGQVDALAKALAFLRRKGCHALYHLGDICDSLHPETADACVGLLREFQVNCVKGNNDHALVVNHEGQKSTSINVGTVDYLRRLPLVIHLRQSLLAHSLPFEKELGLASMVGTMTEDYAQFFFDKFAGRILFRGHSHSPVITWQNPQGRAKSRAIPPGQPIDITKCTPRHRDLRGAGPRPVPFVVLSQRPRHQSEIIALGKNPILNRAFQLRL